MRQAGRDDLKLKTLPHSRSFVGWFCLLLLMGSGCLSSDGIPVKAPVKSHLHERQATGQPLLFTLEAETYWHLQPPAGERFDASGLLFTSTEELFTVNDRSPELYRISLERGIGHLTASGFFKSEELRKLPPFAETNRFDTEGIAQDQTGAIYICEESARAVFRYDSKTKKVEHLPIDFSSMIHFFSGDPNASFEGIAVGGDKLFLANERSRPRIIVVDLASLNVIDSFVIHPVGFAFGGPHYSDLAYFDDRLFILDRNHRAILEVAPHNHSLLAQYSFSKMELQPEVAFKTLYPTGTMEGLAVTKDHFYLVTDNNGLGRLAAPQDKRPILFRALRPRTD